MNALTKPALFEEQSQMSLPDLLKMKRSEMGMTQKELAEKAGLSLSAVKQYETARAEPTMMKLKAMSRVLGISPDDIWSELNVGTVNDERLRLAVLQEATQFIASTASREQLEKVRAAIAEMTGAEMENISEVNALEVLRGKIVEKGFKSRSITKAIMEAKSFLDGLDLDELLDLSEEYGIVFEVEEGDEAAEDVLSERILISEIYGADLMARPNDDIEKILSWINSESEAVEEAGFFENKDKYIERLKLQLPKQILAQAMKRKFMPELV